MVEFVIPEGGLLALPRNVYIDSILNIQRRAAKHLKPSTAAAATTATQSASMDGARRSCTSVVQTATDHGDDWPAPSAAERGRSLQ